jgi:outer membrane lipoprotein-sorting protein
MTTEETIEKRLERLAQAVGPDETLVEYVMSCIDPKSIASPSTVTTQNIWRTIMKSPITKLSFAAMIFIAAAITITFLDKSVSPAYGITDVPEIFKKAKVIHVQGWIHFNLTDKGKKVPKAPVERWIDLENGRVRFTQTVVNADPEQVTVTIRETILNGQYRMVLNHGSKEAVFYRTSDYQRIFETHHRLQDMFGYLFGNIETFENFIKTDQEEIDGISYDIWTCEVKESDSALDRINRYNYWLSPTTGESRRFQYWYKNGQEPWRLGHDFYKIERDVQIDEDVFSLEIPEGYEARNTKETAISVELNEQGYLGQNGIGLDARISFTLSDGSVILGWRSVDTKSAVSQRELFDELIFGGTLPRLPVEVYALKPIGWTGNITYTGRHLAYTQKDDKLIEWSLYVPDGAPPKRSEMLGYELLCRFNTEQQVDRWSGMSADYGIKIEMEKDFDKWVHGAMAELSDDSKAPEDITYEKVLQLTKQIRKSLAQ